MDNNSTAIGIAKPACRCCKVLGLIVVGCVLVVLVAGSQVGRWLEAPGQPASKADVIVILGGDTGSRLSAALEFYRRGLAPKLFLAGVESDDLSTYNPMLNLRLQYLLAQGVPREAIVVDRQSSNSWEEAANTLKLMHDSGWHKALVISDPPHLRRLSWVWSKVFVQADPAFVLVASRPSWWHSRDWWHDEKSGVFVLMEVIKLGYYYAVR
jgi:uncharacterized SAM-binding protein YcdF (DUF218 family)